MMDPTGIFAPSEECELHQKSESIDAAFGEIRSEQESTQSSPDSRDGLRASIVGHYRRLEALLGGQDLVGNAGDRFVQGEFRKRNSPHVSENENYVPPEINSTPHPELLPGSSKNSRSHDANDRAIVDIYDDNIFQLQNSSAVPPNVRSANATSYPRGSINDALDATLPQLPKIRLPLAGIDSGPTSKNVMNSTSRPVVYEVREAITKPVSDDCSIVREPADSYHLNAIICPNREAANRLDRTKPEAGGPQCSEANAHEELEKLNLTEHDDLGYVQLSSRKSANRAGCSDFLQPRLPFTREPAQYVCTRCSAYFADCDSWKRHQRRAHTNSTANQAYTCSICSITLKSRHNLKRHMDAIHASNAVYSCDDVNCNATFSSKKTRRDHFELVHLQQSTTAGSAPSQMQKEQVQIAFQNSAVAPNATRSGRVVKKSRHEGVALFKCNECQYSSRWSGNVRRHTKICHMGLKPFRCRWCSANFATKSNCATHETVHKGEPIPVEGETQEHGSSLAENNGQPHLDRDGSQ